MTNSDEELTTSYEGNSTSTVESRNLDRIQEDERRYKQQQVIAHRLQEQKDNGPKWVPFIAGGVAGVTAKTIVAPLERVKILYQIRSQHYSHGSVVGSLTKIFETEGLKGLWRGNNATIARVFPYAAVQFFTYENMKKRLNTEKDIFSPTNLFLAGSVAGGAAVLATYPLDLIRARLAIEVTPDKYTTMKELFADTLKKDGVRGLYRGIESTLVGILPYAGISFMMFETLKMNAPYSGYNQDGSLKAEFRLFAGGVAGGVAQTVSYPFEVVRRRMQTHGFGDGKVEIDLKHSSIRSMYRIVKAEGFLSLYKGLSINYIKVIPTSAVAFYTYDLCSQLLYRLAS
ncbi:hypothetical protein SAMD00019534_026180 [Acytostelium subglobosum LB1]|uniref:hypothetical protein n=1 Tax=Acytostelium subglobosum LB1 TaxID=1410327 RepID=UPI000644D781|nr:hypothetical protein SAMD00019534_026180 [Acytostelium subglobosum LB1]GAM19443.1 hypothetical protein SAMD00019534_026180 [Acytostelium subglobosum LB1]|eukprot:XP_012757370.1 hypothetical protein SAMD00019534_026180 [Acytostelium subglobosum LB1]